MKHAIRLVVCGCLIVSTLASAHAADVSAGVGADRGANLGVDVGVDLGVIGPVYPIAEPNFLEWITTRLRDKQASGELQRLQEEARTRAVERIEHPPALAGITASEQARTFYLDPSVTLQRNLFAPDGQLLFAAGTRKNQLEVDSLSKLLLFFDARDGAQIARARALIDFYQGRVKPILTGGSYRALMKTWRIPVYYDQFGALTRRLGIEHVPALVSQEGLRLRIDELGPGPHDSGGAQGTQAQEAEKKGGTP